MSVAKSGPGFDELIINIEQLDGVRAGVGWFETAAYPDGTPVAYVAAIHEFGAPKAGIPPRPFMRPAIADNGPEWMKHFEEGAAACLRGETDARTVLESVALVAAGDVSKKIKAVTAPGLKPATIKRKGFAKPLVDTGQMAQSVTGKIMEDGEGAE